MGSTGRELASDGASESIMCGEWCGHCGGEHGPVLWARHNQTRVMGVGSGEHHTHSIGRDKRDVCDMVESRRADGPALSGIAGADPDHPERAVKELLKLPWLVQFSIFVYNLQN